MNVEVQGLFERIERLRDSIPVEEQKETAERIISVLREHQLTFSQAMDILDLTKSTLDVMSRSLLL